MTKGSVHGLSIMTGEHDHIEIDLDEIRRAAEQVRGILRRLRAGHDVARFEFTTRVRIAPGEIPHSHPVLTLNTAVRTEEALLSIYLHEQMHWYVTWYSHARPAGWRAVLGALETRYPGVPIAFPEGAHTLASSHLHLIVNWLEVEAVAALLGRETAVAIASENFVYSGLYRIVLDDRDDLSRLYREHGLAPIRAAADMIDADRTLAARMDEAVVGATCYGRRPHSFPSAIRSAPGALTAAAPTPSRP